MYKLRLVYMKSKTSVYIPSIDICDVIAKALIRIGAKLSYSNGKNVKPEIVITHSPGHMLITDIKNVNLKY